VKTVRKSGMLKYTIGPLEFLFGNSIAGRATAFEQDSATVTIRSWIPLATPKTIHFHAIRRVRHIVGAPIISYQDSNRWHTRRGSTQRLQILLDLLVDEQELIYQCGSDSDSSGLPLFRWFPTSKQVADTQKIAEDISRFIGKPMRIDLEEAEFSLDMETRAILFSGEFLPPDLRGTITPFDDVRAIRAVRRPDGYIAACVVDKRRGDLPTMQKYESNTDLHETLGVAASSAGLPFELDQSRLPGECFGTHRQPIHPR